MKQKSGIFPTLSKSYSRSSPETKEKVTSLGVLALILALIFASGPLSALVINVFFNQASYNAGDTVYTTLNVTTLSNEVFLPPVYYSVIASNGSYTFQNRQAQAVNCNSSNFGFGYGYAGYGYGYGSNYTSGAPCSYVANFTLSDFQANGTYTLLSNVSQTFNTSTFAVNRTLATGRVVNSSGSPLNVTLLFTEATNHSNSISMNVYGNFSINFNPNKNFKIRLTPAAQSLPPLFTAVRSTPYAFGDIVVKKSIPPGLVQNANGTPNITVNISDDVTLNFSTSNTTETSVIENLVTNNNSTANATVIVPVNLLGTNITVNLTLNVPNGSSRPIYQVPEQGLIVSPTNANLTDVKINAQSQELRLSMTGSGIQDIVLFSTVLPKQFRFNNGTGWRKLSQGTGLWTYNYSVVPDGYLISATVKYSSPGNFSVTWRELNGTTAVTSASSYSNGDTVNVSGTVKDDLGASVSGATVAIYRDGSLINTTTGGAYSYAFADSAAGTHTLLVNASLDGYNAYAISISYTVGFASGGGGSSSSHNTSNVSSSSSVVTKKVTTPAPVTPVTPVTEGPAPEAPKDVTQPVVPADTLEQRSTRDLITIASNDIEARASKLSSNPAVQSLLDAARQKIALADLMFAQGNYEQARQLVVEARALIDQADEVSVADAGSSSFKMFSVLIVLLSAIVVAVYYGYLKYGEKKVNPFTSQPHDYGHSGNHNKK